MKKIAKLFFLTCFLLPLASVGHAADFCAPSQHTASAIWGDIKTYQNNRCGETERKATLESIPTIAVNDDMIKTFSINGWKVLIAKLDEHQRQSTNSEIRLAYQALIDRASAALADVSSDQHTEVTGKNAWEIELQRGLILQASSNQKTYEIFNLAESAKTACTQEGASCPLTFRDLNALLTFAAVGAEVASIKGLKVIENQAEIASNANAAWNRFIFSGKPMYPLDLIATDYLNTRFSSYKSDDQGLRLPPDWQFFFLHPSPAFEYVSDAEDGEQLKATFIVEVFGANRWDSDNWITGAALVAAYTDRKEVSDFGPGFQLTFANKYDFSVVNHGGDWGVLLNIDLANWYRESLKPRVDKIR